MRAGRLLRLGRRTNERLYGSTESFLARVETGAVALDELHARGGPYPTELLVGCESALVLFGAAFLGINDAIHVAAAGIADVTVVDVDAARLATMRSLYPAGWEFVESDAFDFAGRQSAAHARYDLVSADPWTDLMPRCRDLLPTLVSLARRAVVLGVEPALSLEAPAGWDGRRIERSALSDWLVLEANA